MSSEPSLETVRLRFMNLASWHRDVSQLDEAMAKALGHHKNTPLPPSGISMDHDANVTMMNYAFDLIRRVHPVVPPEPKRLADKLASQLSLIPDPSIQGMLKLALTGEPVSLKMKNDGSGAMISNSLP